MTSFAEKLRALRRGALRGGLSWLGVRRRRIVAWRAMAATGVSTVTFSRNGLIWRVPAGDPHIGFGLFVEGGFGQAAIDALLAWLESHGRAPGPGDVIVDAGANIGSSSIPIVHTTGCRALAIEPVPATFGLLRENVEMNGLADRFVLVNAAVARSHGPVVMEAGTDIGAAAVSPGSASCQQERGTAAAMTCIGVPLADVLSTAHVDPSRVALVWADVQGCETAVIETGAELWSRGVPLWAEFEPGLLERHGGVDAFHQAAERHFDRFVEGGHLLREGRAAVPLAMGRLREMLSRELLQTDVLLLPPGFP